MTRSQCIYICTRYCKATTNPLPAFSNVQFIVKKKCLLHYGLLKLLVHRRLCTVICHLSCPSSLSCPLSLLISSLPLLSLSSFAIVVITLIMIHQISPSSFLAVQISGLVYLTTFSLQYCYHYIFLGIAA